MVKENSAKGKWPPWSVIIKSARGLGNDTKETKEEKY